MLVCVSVSVLILCVPVESTQGSSESSHLAGVFSLVTFPYQCLLFVSHISDIMRWSTVAGSVAALAALSAPPPLPWALNTTKSMSLSHVCLAVSDVAVNWENNKRNVPTEQYQYAGPLSGEYAPPPSPRGGGTDWPELSLLLVSCSFYVKAKVSESNDREICLNHSTGLWPRLNNLVDKSLIGDRSCYGVCLLPSQTAPYSQWSIPLLTGGPCDSGQK